MKNKKTANVDKESKVTKEPTAEGESRSDERNVTEQLERMEAELKRALADYRNLERRIDEERRMLSVLSSVLVVEKLLPVLDNLENAQKHLNDQGLEIVLKQFKDVLKAEGLEEIHAEGQSFDPNLHEATDVVEGKNDNRIVKINRKGYKINDKIIRPAQVTVERKQASEKAASDNSQNDEVTNDKNQSQDQSENDNMEVAENV